MTARRRKPPGDLTPVGGCRGWRSRGDCPERVALVRARTEFHGCGRALDRAARSGRGVHRHLARRTWHLHALRDRAAATPKNSNCRDARRCTPHAGGGVRARRRDHRKKPDPRGAGADSNERGAVARQVTELFAKAVEQLGCKAAPVRLGGLYALERLARTEAGPVSDCDQHILRLPQDAVRPRRPKISVSRARGANSENNIREKTSCARRRIGSDSPRSPFL